MWELLDQGTTLHQSSDLIHSSDNTRSLNHCATRELQSQNVLTENKISIQALSENMENLCGNISEKSGDGVPDVV